MIFITSLAEDELSVVYKYFPYMGKRWCDPDLKAIKYSLDAPISHVVNFSSELSTNDCLSCRVHRIVEPHSCSIGDTINNYFVFCRLKYVEMLATRVQNRIGGRNVSNISVAMMVNLGIAIWGALGLSSFKTQTFSTLIGSRHCHNLGNHVCTS